MQSSIKKSQSSQRGIIPPVTSTTGTDASTQMSIFWCSLSAKPVTVTDIVRERAQSIRFLSKMRGDLHPFVQDALQKNRYQTRELSSKEKLPNFTEKDFFLVM